MYQEDRRTKIDVSIMIFLNSRLSLSKVNIMLCYVMHQISNVMLCIFVLVNLKKKEKKLKEKSEVLYMNTLRTSFVIPDIEKRKTFDLPQLLD